MPVIGLVINHNRENKRGLNRYGNRYKGLSKL